MSAHAERVATEVECKIGATENVEDSTEVCRAGDIEDEIKEIDQPELIQQMALNARSFARFGTNCRFTIIELNRSFPSRIPA
jgi:hypothetical protein